MKARDYLKKLWINKIIRGFLAGVVAASFSATLVKHGADAQTAAQIGNGLGEVVRQLPNE